MVRWPLLVLAPLYGIGVFFLFLTRGGPDAVGSFGVGIVVLVTVLSLAPVLSFFMRTRAPSVLATALLALLLVFYVFGLLPWYPLATGLIGAAIAGPPVRPRPSVAADDDRLDALD